jgi:hypothetical protein
MIGDWVWYDNQPYQIRQLGIFGENRDGDDYPAVCVGKPNGIGLIVERTKIEPIPLTTEILEENDFKYGDGYGYSFTNRKEMCGDGFEEEKVYINTDLNVLIIYTAVSTIRLSVKYIHELQHALKLCGIKKEIIL